MRNSEANFSQKIKDLLAKEAGYECSLPYCNTRTICSGAAPEETASVGQASHIYSAAPDGPRGSGGLENEELALPENGIWTCELHGKSVDNNKGKAFPAGLLKAWKKLHIEKIKRSSEGAPTSSWFESIKILRSPIFHPTSEIYPGKVTVIRGDNMTGKTAVCEWIAGIFRPELLNRWSGSMARHALDLEFTVVSDKDRTLGLQIPKGGKPVTFLNGVPQPAPPPVAEVIYLPCRYFSSQGDDLSALARTFNIDSHTVETLVAEVGKSGNSRFRELVFEDVPKDEMDENQVGVSQGENPKCLVVETYTPADRFPVQNMGGATETEVLLAVAIEYARLNSQHTPTLLVLEASAWGFFRDNFERLADAIDECSKFCQILMIEPNVELDEAEMFEREWVLYEFAMDKQKRGKLRSLTTVLHK